MTFYERLLSFNSLARFRSSSLVMGFQFFLRLSHKPSQSGPKKGFLNSVLVFSFPQSLARFCELTLLVFLLRLRSFFHSAHGLFFRNGF